MSIIKQTEPLSLINFLLLDLESNPSNEQNCQHGLARKIPNYFQTSKDCAIDAFHWSYKTRKILLMTPKVTVLIPNYNGARFLDHCFEGLLCQTYQDFECIFLDDGSTDDSLEIAERYQSKLPQLQVLSFKNGGIATNWNRGVELVESEYFTLLHCDDSYQANYLESMLVLLESYPESAIGHCGAQVINGQSEEKFSLTEYYKHALFLPNQAFERDIAAEYRLLLTADFINCPSVMYRTEAIKLVGPFNQQLQQTLDWEYWFRILRADFKICGTNEKLYRYRRHDTNHTIINSKSFARYEEEITSFEDAFEQGVAFGFISGRPDYSGIRNIVIVDIAQALRMRNVAATEGLIGLLETSAITEAPVIMVLKLLKRLGRLGGYGLYFGIYSAILVAMVFSFLPRSNR